MAHCQMILRPRNSPRVDVPGNLEIGHPRFEAEMADGQVGAQQQTADGLRRFLAKRHVEFREAVVAGPSGAEIHFLGPDGEKFIVRADGRLSPHHGARTRLDMAVASANLVFRDRTTGDDVACGCVIAFAVLFLILGGLAAWALWVMPDLDMDFSGVFGDPCREELTMPQETEIPTDRSVVIGWEGECPLFLWLRYVKTTWYYATDETPEQVLASTNITVRAYLESELVESISVERSAGSIEGSGIDNSDGIQLRVKVLLYPARPYAYRVTNIQEPAGFTTYYSVELTAAARNAGTPPSGPAASSTAQPSATAVPQPSPTPSPSPTATPTRTTVASPSTPTPPAAKTPTGQKFVAVSAGLSHTCALTAAGTITCWGSNDYGESNPPTGKFIAVSAGYGFTCALREDRSAACWGYAGEGETRPPESAFVMLSGSCGLRPSGAIECWGHEAGDKVPTAAGFTAISVDRHSCAIRADRSLACWLGAYFATKSGDYGQANPPARTFIDVSAGGFHTCGVREDRTIACWGRITTAPDGRFTAVSAGGWHSCGIREGASVECWGSSGQPAPPSGTFTAISAGGTHTCGIRSDGSIACWGENSQGQASPP